MSQPAAKLTAKLTEPLPNHPALRLHPKMITQQRVGWPPGANQSKLPIGATARLRELRQLQRVIRNQLMEPGRTPQELASLTRAWDTLEARRAILMGHGTPAQVPARNAPTTTTTTDNWTDEGPAPVVIPGGKA